ncbi:MAG: biopolymer transporter ExbD [Proteobacteria bacterium]|jgi:biopolymer transport protein ExbD|nr:biopolymer transporter ExbD [Desulfobacterales bacterium]MBL7101881.1 biopolymer transporter ExbD [Desulfobacteraceae bacterium]MBL7172242.1 biopolymer transporter ExbD [Desulfobacteraceae bacterium]MBU0990364.1 biopolymer transporter ExbD [Pseudomonadota bacterium]MBU1903928.1 biopolymer transporter ExbD [Pseudomonadota bacterium]
MKVSLEKGRKARIEMLPLIDIVFLLLVFFIYAMLSMAVHRALPVTLPTSTTAKIDKHSVLSVTVKSDGSIYLDKEPVPVQRLAAVLRAKAKGSEETSVLLFADRSLPYQDLFEVLDQIRMAGLERISLQAEVD